MNRLVDYNPYADDDDEIIPEINSVSQLKSYLRPIYIINDYMDSRENYKKFIEGFYKLAKGCYIYKKLRDYPIQFKFYEKSKKSFTLPLRHFVINSFYWIPLVEVHNIRHVEIMDESFIINCRTDIPQINDYINYMSETLESYNVKNININYQISESLYYLRRISNDFSQILSVYFDAFSIMDMYQTIPGLKEIMELEIDESMQPSDIEDILHKKQAELISLLKSVKENPIGIILNAKTGIKEKQLAEFMISKGLVPDLDGNTIPLPIKNSILIGGLKTPADLYNDGIGARKSQVMAHEVMGRAGHFGKVLTELSRTLSLSKTVSDCNTKHLVPYFITSKKFLDKLDRKYYLKDPNDPYSLDVIDSDRDTHLIGKTIMVRSAATCALENEVCSKCFGLNANLNFDIADKILSAYKVIYRKTTLLTAGNSC